jgi:hypothetical protein
VVLRLFSQLLDYLWVAEVTWPTDEAEELEASWLVQTTHRCGRSCLWRMNSSEEDNRDTATAVVRALIVATLLARYCCVGSSGSLEGSVVWQTSCPKTSCPGDPRTVSRAASRPANVYTDPMWCWWSSCRELWFVIAQSFPCYFPCSVVDQPRPARPQKLQLSAPFDGES